MPTFESQMFFLGNFADMDTDETNSNSEFASDVLGSYIQPALVNISVNDGNGDGAINDDEFGTSPGEDVVYNLGSGETTQFIDSTIVYNVRVTLGDNSTIDIQATAIQTQNGDVFLTDFANNGSFDNLNVQNIQLLSVAGSNYSGFFANSSVDNTQVVCFAAGTPIMTDAGPIPVQYLREGMAVFTLDHGYQPCLAVTERTLHNPGRKHAPIEINAGALRGDASSTRLRVSPQHRVLISSPVAARMFGSSQVLVAAKELLCIEGVTQVLPFLPVSYYHLLFERHEILSAAGLLTESLLSGPQARKSLPNVPLYQRGMVPARQIAKGHRARWMLERHLINCTPQGKSLSPPAIELHLNARIGPLTCQNTFEPARFVQGEYNDW